MTAGATAAPAVIASAAKHQSGSGVKFERTVLPGGTRVLTESMTEVRSVALGFWVGVGSRDEPSELQGATHFLEHLLFKGTEAHSAKDIAEAFDAVGGEANAFSAKEYTCFHGRILDRDAPMAMELLADMLRRPMLRPEDVESERNVILEELAMHEDTPEDLVHDLFSQALFGEHPLGREVMGTSETVRAISRDDLASFHEQRYQSSNIVVAAAGSVGHEQIIEWLTAEFGPDGPAFSPRVPAPTAAANRVTVVGRPTEQTHIVVGGLGYSRNDPARFAWGVLDNLLGCGTSSRLFQQVRESRGLAYSVFSYRNMYSETGDWAVYAGTAPANVPRLLEVVMTELDELVEKGATKEELERAKGATEGGMVMALEDPASRMSRLGKSELVGAEILSTDEIIARVEAVTLDEVARVAHELLAPERRVLTVLGPFSHSDFRGWQ